jgi:2-oxoglutarate ferredoxin oxidoreductase subunit beta
MEAVQVKHLALKYYQLGSGGDPTLWCSGCGIGQIWYFTVKAMEELELDPDKVVWVGGSGCTGRMCTYWNRDLMHTLHGRPLGFATGIKLANPELTVVCHMGDGETSAIGGNHLIQSARRNVDVVAICVNNFNYGMTGGQFSPTTPLGGITKTSPGGHREGSFDLCQLVKAAGATYVARWTTTHPRQSINAIKKAIQNKGFSFVEIVAQCPTHYGRNNRLGDGPAMMKLQKEMSVRVGQAADMSREDLQDRIVIGEFVNTQRPEYGEILRSFWPESGEGDNV